MKLRVIVSLYALRAKRKEKREGGLNELRDL